jgi:hypothetical protein
VQGKVCETRLFRGSPLHPGKKGLPAAPFRTGTARNFGAVYCVIGDVFLGVVRFLSSCFVVRGFVGWRVAVSIYRYSTSLLTQRLRPLKSPPCIQSLLTVNSIQSNYFIMEPTFSSASCFGDHCDSSSCSPNKSFCSCRAKANSLCYRPNDA